MVTQLEFLILNLNLLTSTFAGRNGIIIALGIAEIIMSVVTVLAYKFDKQKAINNEWRTKEKTLLALPWVMGGIGGFLGIYVIDRKSVV